MPSYLSTLRALAAPRRAVPLGIVVATLVASEALVTGSARACVVDAGLCAAFCLVAPAAWRRAAAQVRRAPGAWIGAYGTFALAAAGLVVAAVLATRALGLAGTYVVDPPALGMLWVILSVGGWGVGRDIDLELGIESAERRAERLALEAERASLVAMRAQLDPHFLFNTLNAIAEWCREDPERAEKATLELAAMLRTILEGSRLPSWPLARELALVEALTRLYAARDETRYRFVLSLPSAGAADVELPPMLLLPLVENAITHGPSAGHAGEVHVAIALDAHEVRVRVDNPGAFRGRREGGQGIAMVERRAALAYGASARFAIGAEGTRTVATLVLPRRPLVPEA
ncbi:MAG: histidine kinase [Sandaracinus sp.]